MAYIHNKDEFIQYCLRNLGAPVVEVNVEEQQIEDRVNEALEFWREYHYDGSERVYLKHQLTQEELDENQIELPELIYGVIRIVPISNAGSNHWNMFDFEYQLRLHDLYDLMSTGIIYYETAMKHLSLLDHVLNGISNVRFNRIASGILYFDQDISLNLTAGEWIIVECYRVLDPEEHPLVYDEPLLRKYATSMIKKQWGTNLKKYSGIQLPGAVLLDGDKLYREAVEEIKELEAEMMDKSAPLGFFTG